MHRSHICQVGQTITINLFTTCAHPVESQWADTCTNPALVHYPTPQATHVSKNTVLFRYLYHRLSPIKYTPFVVISICYSRLIPIMHRAYIHTYYSLKSLKVLLISEAQRIGG